MTSNNIQILLEKYNITKRNFQDDLIAERLPQIKSLLINYELTKQDFIKWNKSKAVNYNIFEILNIKHLETITHTPFLVNLLKPSSSHGQGLLFYNLLLEQIKFKEYPQKLEKFKTPKIEVFEEKSTANYGRIDILIQSKGNVEPFALIIENKIYASDQDMQLERYYNYCTRVLGLKDDNILLIYLSPEGNMASETSMNIEKQQLLIKNNVLVNLGYKENIQPLLYESLNKIEAENVKTLINQYLEIIKIL